VSAGGTRGGGGNGRNEVGRGGRKIEEGTRGGGVGRGAGGGGGCVGCHKESGMRGWGRGRRAEMRGWGGIGEEGGKRRGGVDTRTGLLYSLQSRIRGPEMMNQDQFTTKLYPP